MVEHKIQSGYIKCMDKPYIFTYDGDLLQLVPKDEESIKPYDFLINKNMNYDVLEGDTIGSDKIYFLNCHLKVSLSGYIAKPAGYVCFSNNERKFDVITFKSGIVDYFYRPNHIIDKENTQYDYNTGGAALKLKTFNETSKQIEVEVAGKKAMLTLSVTLPGEPLYMQIDYNLGKPKSIFRLTFNEPVDINEFRMVYMWIYNLMVFLNFRKDISLGKIDVGKTNEENRIEQIGYVYLNEKEKNNKMMIDILSQIVEFRNNESGMHVRNISTLTGMLLEKIVQKTDKYYLSWSKRFYITNGSALHDIGKIGIPEEILNKPGKLTKEEYEIIKEHTVIGEKMLKNLELYQDEPLIKTACEIVRWHHERYDGNGYPDGLKGDEIPISAQIVSIADVYDELVSERVYKEAFSHEKAMEMILNGECGAFNPLLLECLVEIQDRIKNELDGSGSVKKETYKKNIQGIERDMNINTL